ncbi:hypothetical protein H0H93_010457, partial [Arthromyces matolae]
MSTGWGNGSGSGNGNGNGSMVFEVGPDEDEEEKEEEEEKGEEEKDPSLTPSSSLSSTTTPRTSTPASASASSTATASVPSTTFATATSLPLSSTTTTTTTTTNTTTTTTTTAPAPPTTNLDLLLSLDVALEMIHADREALKRVETFAEYPGHYGHRVRDTMEEVFVLLLGSIGEGHLRKGFLKATEQMREYKPSEHEVMTTTSVAPLLQFFELVHIGDTIQSMVQVYFDKELAHHIDRNDFLNVVVREKKKFENSLDDSVAGGLNAGTEVLMNQIEHILVTLTGPREYYPEDGPLDLGPTRGCSEAI